MKKPGAHLPRTVASRIMRRAARSDEPIVITVRKGKPTRVFGYVEYQKMVGLPLVVKPWEHRKKKAEPPDPLGAVDMGEFLAPLNREAMYA